MALVVGSDTKSLLAEFCAAFPMLRAFCRRSIRRPADFWKLENRLRAEDRSDDLHPLLATSHHAVTAHRKQKA